MGLIPEGKSPTIGYLRPHHRAIARAMVAGATEVECCQMFDFSPAQMTIITNSPLFLAELGRLEAQADEIAVDVNKDIQEMAVRAAEVLSAELDRESSGLGDRRLKTTVALGVLDRAGHSKKDQPIHLHKHAHIHTESMSDEELYRDVLELTADGEG